jgi:Ca-activated chloride channel family protein
MAPSFKPATIMNHQTETTHTPLHRRRYPGESQRSAINPGIREKLEADAWRRYPVFSAHAARRKNLFLHKRRRLRWQDRTLLIIGIFLASLLLLRIETAQAQDGTWGLELLGAATPVTQLALNTDVRVEVTGLIARAEVTQVFDNPGDEWAEGVYRFPLPDGAAVDRLRIQVGERVIEGEIREKETARRSYQQALWDGVTASLVEQQRPNQFETRLANIGPREEIRVTIGFLVNVRFEDDAFSLRLPMTFTPRWDQAPDRLDLSPAPQPRLSSAASRRDQRLNVEFLIRTAIGFAAIESLYHDVDIQPTEYGYRVTLGDGAHRADRDFELVWHPDMQSVPQSALMTWQGDDAFYAQLMMVPPEAGSILHQPREVVFIIDTSGSMEGESLDQARSALVRGLDELADSDYFNLLQFNSQTESLFRRSMPATHQNRLFARHYIDGLVADGGTVMGPALQAAFALPEQPGLMRQVVFVTDGSVGNEKELLAGIADQLGDSRLFTIGIGSAPNSWFMRKAAEVGRGSHTHIGKLDEVEQRMAALWERIRLPALSDICVDWGTEAEFYPEIIPDLYAGQPLWVVARMPLQPGSITICGWINGQYWEQQASPLLAPGTDTLATLWARKKIEALEDGLVFGGDPDWTNTEITRVALDYGLLTAQTSLVAIDSAPARLPGEPLASGDIPSLLPAGSTQGFGFSQTATAWQTRALLSLLTLLVSAWMFFATGTRLPLTHGPHGRPGTSTDAAT